MKRLLIVDDMPIFREPLKAALQGEGYAVDVAGDARGAHDCIARNRPDLVLLDLGLPVVDGIALLKQIRAEVPTRDLKVVVLSAETQRTRIVEAARLGIAGYLLKHDFSLARMLEEVTRVLGPGDAPAPAASAAPAPAAPARATQAAPDAPLPIASATPTDALAPVVGHEELVRLLQGNQELKGFSPAVQQVMKLTSERSSSLDAIANAIRQDPGLSLKVLKIANSSVYSRGDRVETVHKAVTRIGTECIRQAVNNIAIIERFNVPAFRDLLPIEQFWEHSLACGIIAAELACAAHEVPQEERDAAFTAGLLHDVGRVVLAESVGERYVQALELARRQGLPLDAIERQLLATTHADVIADLLTSWNFPRKLVEPVLHHHEEPKASSPRPVEVLRIALADRLAHALLLGRSGNDMIYPIDAHCRSLGVDKASLRRIAASARTQTEETKYALLSHSGTACWQRELDRVRDQFGREIRPRLVSGAPEHDVLRVLLEALDLPTTEAPANVLLVHLHGPRDSETAVRELVEFDAYTPNAVLPVAVVRGSARLPIPVEIERRMTVPPLTLPLPIDALCAALRTCVKPRRAAA